MAASLVFIDAFTLMQRFGGEFYVATKEIVESRRLQELSVATH